MKRLGRLLLVILGLAIVVGALRTLPSTPVAAAGSAPVTVENTPLPVQGTISVNNFPASQGVSGNVNATINGTPNVNITGNSVSNPLLIQPVSAVGNNFWVQSSVSVFFGGSSGLSSTILSVNPDQLAVITSASARCNIDNGTNIQTVELDGSGFTELQYQTSSLGLSEEMTSTLTGPVYVDGGTGGTSVSFSVGTNKVQSTPSDCNFSASGYYLNESH